MRVSVVIPTYNREQTIARALRSVLAQNFSDYEVIVVDDGSTDATATVLDEFAETIKVLQQPKNQGVSSARNRGIHAATGEWLAFLDSDDEWLPSKLTQQMDYIKDHPKDRIVQTEEIWIRHGRRVNPREVHRKRRGWIFPHMLQRCLVSPSAAMVHSSVFASLGLFDESLPACEDYDFWLRAGVRYPIGLVDEPLTIKYGGHADQLSKQWGLDRYRIQSLVKIREGLPLPDEWRHALNQELIKKCEVYLSGLRKRMRLDEAARYEEILATTREMLEKPG